MDTINSINCFELLASRHYLSLVYSLVLEIPIYSKLEESYEDKNNYSGFGVEIGEDITKENGTFEGDLKIPKELILSQFNFDFPGGEALLKKLANDEEGINSSVTKHRDAVDGSIVSIWRDHTIKYIISPIFDDNKVREIRRAMNHWEKNTCLRFVPLDREGDDYIEFINTGGSCYSSYIGRQGGRQEINLAKHCTFGLIVHEIGHALGFWHEQSRPDRDNYITLHYENMKKFSFNFLKQVDLKIDFQGSPYDYHSVMHYPKTWGKKEGCRGKCYTMTIKNLTEYRRQGSPTIGRFRELSQEDIKQANRLYSCPNEGILGFLSFQVKLGKNLHHYRSKTVPNPFIVFEAVDSKGIPHIRQTTYKRFTRDPVWNEIVMFGENEWQFFRIRIWDYSLERDYILSMSQTVPMSSGLHRNIKHCENVQCRGHVMFDYSIDPRLSVEAKLKIHVHSAYQLADTDRLWDKPDPYVVIEGIQSDTSTVQQMSKTVKDTFDPVWDQWISFGCKKWNSFLIQLKDEDVGIDDILSDREWVSVYLGFHSHRRHDGHGNGYLSYDYELSDCSQ